MKYVILLSIVIMSFMGAVQVIGSDEIMEAANPAAPAADNITANSESTPQTANIEPVYPMSTERAQLLTSYSRHKNIWRFVGFIIDVIILLIILYTGLSGKLRRWAEAISRRKFLIYFFYLLFFMVVMFILNFPVGYYTGFVVQHDYGFSNQTFSDWFTEDLKSSGVSFIFAFILVLILYKLINSFRRWWLYFSIGAIPFAILLIVIVPIFVSPLFNKFEPLKDRHLAGEMRNLAEKAGIDDPDIYQVNASKQSKKLNAYFTGMFGTRRIVLYDTMIDALSVNELKYVMGHEIGHYKMNHIWKGLFLAVLIIFIFAFLTDRLLPRIIRSHGHRLGFNKLGDVASLPLILLFMTVFMFVVQPVSNGLSRHYEYQADEFGFKLSGATADEARIAFEKLSAYNLSDPAPSPLIEFWFYDHPSLNKRIDNLKNLDDKMRSGA